MYGTTHGTVALCPLSQIATLHITYATKWHVLHLDARARPRGRVVKCRPPSTRALRDYSRPWRTGGTPDSRQGGPARVKLVSLPYREARPRDHARYCGTYASQQTRAHLHVVVVEEDQKPPEVRTRALYRLDWSCLRGRRKKCPHQKLSSAADGQAEQTALYYP